MIERLVIQNFLKFDRLDIKFDSKMNILVGDNDTGKSTIVTALEMVLTGRYRGRSLDTELSPHWFTRSAVEAWLADVRSRQMSAVPSIFIEVYFEDSPTLAEQRGKNNSRQLDVPGIRLDICLDAEFEEEYRSYISDAESVSSIPVEFFRVDRHDFSGRDISRSRPVVTAALIDASTLKLQSGTDYYLRKSISEHLTPDARAKLSLAFRNHKEELARDPAFVAANESIDLKTTTLGRKSVTLATDASAKSSWESGLVPHLDSIPFDQIGKGEQSAFKILLALERDGAGRHVVMVEEPENHLSHANLSKLVGLIRDHSVQQQVFITTHSSFVLNKLGIDKLRLLSTHEHATLDALPAETKNYFLKLAGYDTLRMVLARAVILVEGPSDELIVQKAYHQVYGRLPIEDGIDVLSVQSLAFKRFLELGRSLSKKIAVITDLDDDSSDSRSRRRFEDFEVEELVKGFVGRPMDGRTLEPQLVASAGRDALNNILGQNARTDSELSAAMANEKTDCALKIFESEESVTMPGYIEDAIAFVK
ncbi:ATP-dependent nuclease [Paramicrobacterium fandaimingii]|uniref:ATP-dependent nuclease n=1 Tax=Paramicrobacterium fandaimingii TaxID=2708079 RepID=UPI001422B7D3|nr:AAA family ATPase [Microbacterium fandaimingii]